MKAARYFSSKARPFRLADLLLVVCAFAAISGCARPAPELPPDYGSVNPVEPLPTDRFNKADLALLCSDIAGEQLEIVRRANSLTGVIASNRAHNQAVGYFGGLFLFPLFAARNNDSEKAQLDAMQVRWDTLELLKRHKACPSATG